MAHIELKLKYNVSIHAPREGCDHIWQLGYRDTHLVSIHAPREGCDEKIVCLLYSPISFNSRTPGGVRRGRYAPTADL